MFTRLKEPFGKAGLIVAIVALAAATVGGAYAASNKKKSPKFVTKPEAIKIAKKFATAGPAGPAGLQGPKGDNGSNGKDGAPGQNGSPGPRGKSVAVTAISAGGSECEGRAGATVEEEGSGTAVEVCEGREGSPWVADTAPSHVILKGTWSIQQYTATSAGENIPVPVSTGVPINPTDATLGIWPVAGGTGLSNGGNEPYFELFCPGSAEHPTVDVEAVQQNVGEGGFLCVYAQSATNLTPPEAFNTNEFILGESGAGFVAMFHAAGAGEAKGYGSWALYTR